MGTVYRARDPVLDRLVALKTIRPGVVSGQEAMARFRREARSAAGLQHPNIVTIYELGQAAGLHFIAMELLEGQDLGQAMHPPERLPLVQKLRMLARVCAGLDYAHKRGVVHRDVKPANVRVQDDRTVKIVDFGIAHVTDSELTATGIVLGTPSYVAPEVLAGGRVDFRADMWAVGIILFEMLAGRRPFVSPTFASLAYRIIHEPLPALDAQTVALWPGVAEVVARALAKRPDDRFRDMAEMAQALQRLLGAPAETVSLGPREREEAWRQEFERAQRLAAAGDLEGALEAARRAQALEPGRTDGVALVEAIETRLREAPTLPPGAVDPTRVARALAAAPPASALAAPAAPVAPAPAPPPGPAVPDVRGRGAAAFREIDTFGEPPAALAAAVSPVRDLLGAAGTDGAVRLWDLAARTRTGVLRTELHLRAGHDARALVLAFSPDGTLLATGHVDGSVHLWDLPGRQEAPVRLKHEGAVGALAFSPDGAILASGGMDNALKLWDVGAALAGEARRELVRQPAGVTALAYAEGGSWIVTGHASRVLRITDVFSGRLVATVRGVDALVNLLALAPDGQKMLVGSHDRSLRVFDVEQRSGLAVVGTHRKTPVSVAYFPDGEVLASVCLDNAVSLWSADASGPLATLWGRQEDAFTAVAVFGDGAFLAAALTDGRIRVWGAADPFGR